MLKLLGISGSLRRGSFNTQLLQAAAKLLPEDATLDIQTLHGIPLYDADLEAAEGIPAAVSKLKDLMAAADGLVLATPEYNNGIPGVFKNAIDWASRPPADTRRVFVGKRVALMGASPGGFGTILSRMPGCPCCGRSAPNPGRAPSCCCRGPTPYSMPRAGCPTPRASSTCANTCKASASSSAPARHRHPGPRAPGLRASPAAGRCPPAG